MVKHMCTTLLLAFVCLSGAAQESVAPRVAIPLIASSHHRPISVTVDSLVITDQKMPVTGASLVRGADLPLELGVLIDTSGSQRSAPESRLAAEKLVAESLRGPQDRAFFLNFATTPRATQWLNREQVQSTKIRVTIGGGTALYDAVAMACRARMGAPDRQKPTRRILVLISDGDDNQSHITREEATSEALRAGVVIFALDTLPLIENRGSKMMETWAEMTGGESFSAAGPEDARMGFAKIKELLEGMYYLTYVPPDGSSSAVHEVEVKRASKEKFKLSYARKYFWTQ